MNRYRRDVPRDQTAHAILSRARPEHTLSWLRTLREIRALHEATA